MTDNAASSDTAWLPADLAPVAFRLARVDQAVHELGQLSASWSSASPFAVEVEHLPSGDLAAIVRGIRPVPPLIAMVFSEGIHHLRAAIENTLFFLVEEARGSQLTEQESSAVEMPVKDDETAFAEWQQRKRRKLPEVDAGSKLGGRIESLQPYVDTVSTVPSRSIQLAGITGETVDFEHPLRLLQRYSNTDKHRKIRLAVTQSIPTTSAVPLAEADRSWRQIEVGTVLATTPPGKPVGLELNSAVMIQRPDRAAMVGPAAELSRLHAYVAGTVIPTLVKGVSLSRSLPPDIDLGDNGKSDQERLESAGWVGAHDRWQVDAPIRMFEWSQKPPTLLATPKSPEG